MSISVIIPTYNGEKSLSTLLGALRQQTVVADEVIVIDSSSSDKTLAVAREFGAITLSIPQESFDHGGTRTRAALMARGDILVFFTQDALPADDRAVEFLVEPLLNDPEVATTYGRQLANDDAGFSASYLRSFNYPDFSVVRSYASREKYGIATIFTSNSFAAYRTSNLADVGYFRNGLIFGEDTCTVGRLLQKGLKIAYVSEAKVYHSHNYTYVQEFKRSFDIGVLHTIESAVFADFGSAESRGKHFVFNGIKKLLKAGEILPVLQFSVRSVLKLIGYKAGRHHGILPGVVVRWCSMHRLWWDRQRTQ